MAPKEKRERGRPRKLTDGSIMFNVRLPPETWAELHARAERKGVPMSDLARDALGEWLLACSQGQRPISARGTS
jgi:predicted HicB family RNase H-like nuclease